MTLKRYIALMMFGTAVACAAIFMIVTNVEPNEAGALMFVLFYVAFFCAALGLSTLLGLLGRLFLRPDAMSVPQKVELSFRQGILMGLLATVAIILKGNDMLTFWNSLLIVGVVSSIEMAFMGLTSRR